MDVKCIAICAGVMSKFSGPISHDGALHAGQALTLFVRGRHNGGAFVEILSHVVHVSGCMNNDGARNGQTAAYMYI